MKPPVRRPSARNPLQRPYAPVHSSRLSIADKALEEILTRLRDALPGEATRALTEQAFVYDLEIAAWRGDPPTPERRREIVGKLMDLTIEVMRLPPAGEADQASTKKSGT